MTYFIAIGVITTRYKIDIDALVRGKTYNVTYFMPPNTQNEDIIFIEVVSHIRDQEYLYVVGNIGDDTVKIPAHTIINVSE